MYEGLGNAVLVLNHATQIDISEAGEIHGLKKLSISVWDDDVDLSPISNLTELEELTLSIYNREMRTEPILMILVLPRQEKIFRN